jgi:hypothetical protein
MTLEIATEAINEFQKAGGKIPLLIDDMWLNPAKQLKVNHEQLAWLSVKKDDLGYAIFSAKDIVDAFDSVEKDKAAANEPIDPRIEVLEFLPAGKYILCDPCETIPSEDWRIYITYNSRKFLRKKYLKEDAPADNTLKINDTYISALTVSDGWHFVGNHERYIPSSVDIDSGTIALVPFDEGQEFTEPIKLVKLPDHNAIGILGISGDPYGSIK